MSKLTTSVSMRVSQEEYEKDLKEPLKKLGYNELVAALSETFPILVSNLFGNKGELGISSEAKEKYNRHFIDHYNPQLFLALAAMTEGEDWIVGEWLVFIKGNKIFQCESLNGHNSDLGYADKTAKDLYRKATKEELINHFTKENVFYKKENKTDMKKEIIGYKLIKPEYLEIVEKITGLVEGTLKDNFERRGWHFVNPCYVQNKLKDLGLIDIWCEPVFKQQEQIFKVGNFEVKVKDGKVFHCGDDITEFTKGLINHFKVQPFGGYIMAIEDVTFSKTGCQTTSKLSEWLEVFKALNN